MRIKYRLRNLLLMCLLAALFVSTANALEYDFDAPEDYLFGKPTSQDVIYEEEDVNVNRSKTAALMPPGFGTPTSYLPGSGEYLTPNLAPGGMSGGLVNSIGNMDYTSLPSADGASIPNAASGDSMSWSMGTADSGTVGFTDVTSDLYYAEGHLGTLSIPSIGVNVKIYEGTDSATLARGIGHFNDTSIWSGNVCLAAHNRGVNAHFGKIHTLSEGDTITLTTQLGTRTYSVTSVEKVSETDNSGTASTSSNQITLYTCVRDERDFRWCVVGVEVV